MRGLLFEKFYCSQYPTEILQQISVLFWLRILQYVGTILEGNVISIFFVFTIRDNFFVANFRQE